MAIFWVLSWLLIPCIWAQCPWQETAPELQSACICAFNLRQELSVQCDAVDFTKLLRTLDKFTRNIQLDLLYINNSSLRVISNGSFINLKIYNLQLSGCKIRTITPAAFRGLETQLRHLNLQDNELEDIPIESIRSLKNLTQLDLSKNHLTKIPDEAFLPLRNLATIKLSDNNLTLSKYAFRGLENSLKNLNLKGTRQNHVPESIKNLKSLAFLDLAQNIISELPGSAGEHIFDGLESLAALNLERNVIQNIGSKTFQSVRNTLSSLSLLNNLLTEFPSAAINSLSELRVLDIGFNLITKLPLDAFLGTPSLTLLALDGNPMKSIQGAALLHLNSTLRGLSVGGHFLHCDCHLRWITEWIKQGDLQVTSRERNPQFCASPPHLRDKLFYNIDSKDLICDSETASSADETELHADLKDDGPVEVSQDLGEGVGYAEPLPPSTIKAMSTTGLTSSTTTTKVIKQLVRKPTSTSSTSTSTSTTTTTTIAPTTTALSTTEKQNTPEVTSLPSYLSTIKHISTASLTRKGIPSTTSKSGLQPWYQQSQRPSLIHGYPSKQPEDVIVRSAHRHDSSVIIQWDSDTSNILGFRVIYRLFGDKTFKQGPPLESSEREFRIKNVPSQECIIVCVISLEEINITPDTVPHNQCREVRTVTSPTNNMDKITIAASAAICGTVVIAVIIFVAASRRRSHKLDTLQNHRTKVGIPVACCPNASPDPHSSLATLSAFANHKDWDQNSVYSNHSLSRSRIYHMDQQGEDLHSHISQFTTKASKTRSIADGQSHNSLSNHSGHYLSGNAYAAGLVNSRPELRQSRQSLATSDRASRVNYPNMHAHVTSSRRQRPRSRPRDTRPSSRYSTAGSTHTLNNYCGDTSDNWTDHDMDIYMARNPTTRNGLVPL